MNSILKWLHRNDLLVHVVVTLAVFYGIPVVWLSLTNSGMVAPIIHSALTGLTLVILFFVAFKAAALVTELIKVAVERADLVLAGETVDSAKSLPKDPVVDYASPTMLVMDSLPKQNVSADITLVPQPSDVVAKAVPVEKKRRGRPTKAGKKEE